MDNKNEEITITFKVDKQWLKENEGKNFEIVMRDGKAKVVSSSPTGQYKETYTDMIRKLKEVFIGAFPPGTSGDYINGKWVVLKKAYTQGGRYYHNPFHLNDVYNELFVLSNKAMVKDNSNAFYVALVFAMFYHDFHMNYNKKGVSPEYLSAVEAFEVMTDAHIPIHVCNHATSLIMLTEGHNSDRVGNVIYGKEFVNADLGILASNADKYNNYSKNIKLEVMHIAHISNEEYNVGRKNFLVGLLRMGKIFHYKSKKDNAAMRNIENEIKNLTKE